MTEHVPVTTGTEADADARRRRREGNTLLAAMLTNGPNELIDFVLPLWAGAAIGLSATEVGVLLAAEMVLSMLFRPVAGVLADTVERRYVAAAGAALYGVSAAGYALAQSAPVAYAAAAVGGVGGALLWVSVRAIVSERLAEDSAVFPRLLSSQETGAWVAFIAGLTLIGLIGYTGVFLACAAACAAAAVLLLVSPRRPGHPRTVAEGTEDTEGETAEGTAAAGLGAVGRRLRPMLLAVVLTMTAESAVSLLLLLHLQRGFGLEIGEIAYVFLPGAIAMSVAAEHLHRYVVRFGRSRVLMAASLSSAGFAVGLAWAPNPFVIAGLWILSGLAWAAVIPIGQAVIAEASGEQAGRGMGVYESARLLGALTGSLAAGALYDSVDWTVACLVAAVPLLAGAVVVPRAVRRLGVADVPPPAPERPEKPARPEQPEEPGAAAGIAAGGKPGAEVRPRAGVKTTAAKANKHRRKRGTPRQIRVELGRHAALFAVTQLLLLVLGLSWIKDLFTGDFLGLLLSGGTDQGSGAAGLLYGAGRIWVFILIGDALWQGFKLLALTLRRPSPEPGSPESPSPEASSPEPPPRSSAD